MIFLSSGSSSGPGFTLLLMKSHLRQWQEIQARIGHPPIPWVLPAMMEPCNSILTTMPPWSPWTVSSWETMDQYMSLQPIPQGPHILEPQLGPDFLHHYLPELWWCPESRPLRVLRPAWSLTSKLTPFCDLLTSYLVEQCLLLEIAGTCFVLSSQMARYDTEQSKYRVCSACSAPGL